jgi:hypothetical protein
MIGLARLLLPAAALFALPCSPATSVDAAPDESVAPPGPWQHPPALPRPAGTVVRVATEPQLQAAVRALKSGTTILLAPGTYRLSNLLQIRGSVKDVALRGDTRDRNRVVLRGPGMRNPNYGTTGYGIMVSNATDVLIANLSVGDVWFHPITLQGGDGCKRVHLYNVRLFDAGQQLLKSNPNGKGGGVDDCKVEYCVFEFTDTSRYNYTEGMSVHTAANWVIRNNLFRNIRGPKADPLVGGCIDVWHGSRNTLVEGNVIVNCRMGIRLGFTKRTDGTHDHEGGIIRNNMIWRKQGAVAAPDTGIMVGDSPGTKVLHNTVVLNGTYAGGAIEYRWCDQVLIANNLTDAMIWRREQAEGSLSGNLRTADRDIYVNAAAGNLHLSAKGARTLGRVPRLADCLRDLAGNERGPRTYPGADEPAAAGR